jgi:hypothetical protein
MMKFTEQINHFPILSRNLYKGPSESQNLKILSICSFVCGPRITKQKLRLIYYMMKFTEQTLKKGHRNFYDNQNIHRTFLKIAQIQFFIDIKI